MNNSKKYIIFVVFLLLLSQLYSNNTNFQNDTIYKIQLRASYKIPLNIDSLSQQLEIKEEISEYYHKRYYTYTIFEFDNLYISIDTLLSIIKHPKVGSAFIVKFIKNERVYFDSDHYRLIQYKKAYTPVKIYKDTIDKDRENTDSVIYKEESKRRPILISSDSIDPNTIENITSIRKQFVQNIGSELEDNINITQFKYIKQVLDIANSNIILFLILVLIIYFFLLSIALIIIILTSRLWGNYQKNKTQRLKDQYHEIIAGYLFNEKDDNVVPQILFKQKTSLQKNILVNLIIDLYNNLEGDTSDKLRTLYLNLQLEKVSIARIKKWSWNIKVKGLQELASMDVENSAKYISGYLNSKNDELRAEATIAFVRLNKEKPFAFLDLDLKYFTRWEQLRVQSVAGKYNVKIPDFKKWLLSDNETIVKFALEMIIIYKQHNIQHEVYKLMENPNPEIRELVYKAIGELGLTKFGSNLTLNYSNETEKCKITILNALLKIPSENQILFFKNILKSNKDFKTRFLSCKNLFLLGEDGKKQLYNIKIELKPELDDIYSHLNDRRI